MPSKSLHYYETFGAHLPSHTRLLYDLNQKTLLVANPCTNIISFLDRQPPQTWRESFATLDPSVEGSNSHELETKHSVIDLAIQPFSQNLVTLAPSLYIHSNELEIYNMQNHQKLLSIHPTSITKAGGPISNIGFDFSGKMMAIHNPQCSLSLFDPTFRVIHSDLSFGQPLANDVKYGGFSLSSTMNTMVFSNYSLGLFSWDTRTKQIMPLKSSEHHVIRPTGLTYHPSGALIVSRINSQSNDILSLLEPRKNFQIVQDLPGYNKGLFTQICALGDEVWYVSFNRYFYGGFMSINVYSFS